MTANSDGISEPEVSIVAGCNRTSHGWSSHSRTQMASTRWLASGWSSSKAQEASVQTRGSNHGSNHKNEYNHILMNLSAVIHHLQFLTIL